MINIVIVILVYIIVIVAKAITSTIITTTLSTTTTSHHYPVHAKINLCKIKIPQMLILHCSLRPNIPPFPLQSVTVPTTLPNNSRKSRNKIV